MVAAQVGKAADKAEHAMEYIGTGPGGVERRVAAGTGAGDGAIVGIVREVVVLGDFGQDLFDQERRKARTDGVVFGAAVEARLGVRRRRRRTTPGLMKTPMVTGMSPLWIRLSKTMWLERAVFIDERAAVLEHHRAGGLVGLVLRGDVDPIIAHGAGIDLAGPLVLRDLALRHAGLPLRISPKDIFFLGDPSAAVQSRGRRRGHRSAYACPTCYRRGCQGFAMMPIRPLFRPKEG